MNVYASRPWHEIRNDHKMVFTQNFEIDSIERMFSEWNSYKLERTYLEKRRKNQNSLRLEQSLCVFNLRGDLECSKFYKSEIHNQKNFI